MHPTQSNGRPRVSFSVPPAEVRHDTNAYHAAALAAGNTQRRPSLSLSEMYSRGGPPSPSALGYRATASAVSPSRARVTSRRSSLAGLGGPGTASVARAELPPGRTAGLFWNEGGAGYGAGMASGGSVAAAAAAAAASSLAAPMAPRPELGVTPTQLVVRPTLHKKSVMLVGITDSPDVMNEIAEVLRFAQKQCGPIRGAFRFPRNPPPGIQRPTYSSAVLLVVFDKDEDAERAVQLLNRHIISSGACMSAQPSTAFALDAAAAGKCLRSFVPLSPHNHWSGSDRLWAVMLSSQSPYEPDWDAARRAAERFEAVVIMEREVYLWCSPAEEEGEPLRPGTKRARSRDGTSRAAQQQNANSAIGRSSSNEGPETVQQMFYDQKYGKRSYHVGDNSSFLSRSIKQVGNFFSGRDDDNAEARMRPPSRSEPETIEEAGRSDGRDGERGELPAVRRRRLESGREAHTRALAEADVRRTTGPGATRRLNVVGEAFGWVPGLQYVASLFRRNDMCHYDRVAASQRLHTPASDDDDDDAIGSGNRRDRTGRGQDFASHGTKASSSGHYAFIPEGPNPAQPPPCTRDQLRPLDDAALARQFPLPPVSGGGLRVAHGDAMTAAGAQTERAASPGFLRAGYSVSGSNGHAVPPALSLTADSRRDAPALDRHESGSPIMARRANSIAARGRGLENGLVGNPHTDASMVHLGGGGAEVRTITTGPAPIVPRPVSASEAQKVPVGLSNAQGMWTPMAAPPPRRAWTTNHPMTPFGAARMARTEASSHNTSRIQILSINTSANTTGELNVSEIRTVSAAPSMPSAQRATGGRPTNRDADA